MLKRRANRVAMGATPSANILVANNQIRPPPNSPLITRESMLPPPKITTGNIIGNIKRESRAPPLPRATVNAAPTRPMRLIAGVPTKRHRTKLPYKSWDNPSDIAITGATITITRPDEHQ